MKAKKWLKEKDIENIAIHEGCHGPLKLSHVMDGFAKDEIKSLKQQLETAEDYNDKASDTMVDMQGTINKTHRRNKDLTKQLEKEREETDNIKSVIDNCLNELSNWNNIDGYNTQKALEYIQKQLTQNQSDDGNK